ncbi:hypothetical protein ILYODFUR_025958 [Ilyodon furcidens]|uniref:Uncharacterized protein n=1 Tax=Ilyodon furcidens TaxID=33524 RepID=A0ABV0TY53_9TELE
MVFGFSGMGSISVSWLGLAQWGDSCWVHWGGGLMGFESELIGGWDYFILWRLWLPSLFGPCRPLFCTWPPPWMRMGVVGDWGRGLGPGQGHSGSGTSPG